MNRENTLFTTLLFSICLIALAGFIRAEEPTDGWFNTPERFSGTDSERIAQAVACAPNFGGVVRIPPRPAAEDGRDWWLIDSAILLGGGTTLYLDNCRIKLSDACRDNFIRSANCGLGIETVEPIRDVHIIGIGHPVLQGADHPRATGDSGKQLGVQTYGTDAGKEDQSQYGDWRNIGVLLAKVDGFTLSGFTIRQAHCWSVSLERCGNGKIRDLDFDSTEKRFIDGEEVKVLNVDGLDLRKGCHDITIENLYGHGGDDLLAITLLGGEHKGGQLRKTEVADCTPDMMNDGFNITARNIVGYAAGGHNIVRILNNGGHKLHHVVLDTVIDTSPADITDRATVRIGDSGYGGPAPLGDTSGLIVTNVQTKSSEGIVVHGTLTDSIIANVINYNPDISGVLFPRGEESIRNVQVINFINAAPISSH